MYQINNERLTDASSIVSKNIYVCVCVCVSRGIKMENYRVEGERSRSFPPNSFGNFSSRSSVSGAASIKETAKLTSGTGAPP